MNYQSVDALLAVAATRGAASDHEKLFMALKGVELFFNINTAGHAKEASSTPLVNAGPCLNAVLLCTSKDSDKLSKPFGGIQWEHALQMVLSIPRADGLIIQSVSTAWVGLDRAKIESLLMSNA